jgi:hypothetical protein
MKRVVIESPYADPTALAVAANVAYARRALHDSLRRGEAPFASHLYTQVLDDSTEDECMRGIEAGFVWGACAELVAAYVDFGISRGMRLGIAAAAERGCPVVYRFDPSMLDFAWVAGADDLFAESLLLPDIYNHPPT